MGEFKFTTFDRSDLNPDKIMPVSEKTLPTDFDFNTSQNLTNPVTAQENRLEKELVKPEPVVKQDADLPACKEDSESQQIVNAVIYAKNHIVQEISEIFEKKLEKIDDAIIELISCKAENERLKAKIDNFTKENYKLKKTVKSFRQVVPGIYIKGKNEEVIL
jgi:hypothetical protein